MSHFGARVLDFDFESAWWRDCEITHEEEHEETRELKRKFSEIQDAIDYNWRTGIFVQSEPLPDESPVECEAERELKRILLEYISGLAESVALPAAPVVEEVRRENVLFWDEGALIVSEINAEFVAEPSVDYLPHLTAGLDQDELSSFVLVDPFNFEETA